MNEESHVSRLFKPADSEHDTDPAYELYREAREKMGAGALTQAIELFQDSLKIAGHPKTAELLGECFMKLGRLQEAEGMLKDAVTLGRESRAPLLLAELSILQGNPAYAREMVAESLKRNPTYKPARRLLAKLTEQL